ncbi:hypothetical protein BC936DRAFT_145007 [Jimgerdemannia flammicorona]|uniref:Uncharacterized protein n=1 Tax=Jimgerdemannia flammicorona TaxID=994334 RepID=A0A433DB43_9FUNG|nr:hypothetical protein BC936DRAFT_145007 [Jimgerdemannia flammicorona]
MTCGDSEENSLRRVHRIQSSLCSHLKTFHTALRVTVRTQMSNNQQYDDSTYDPQQGSTDSYNDDLQQSHDGHDGEQHDGQQDKASGIHHEEGRTGTHYSRLGQDNTPPRPSRSWNRSGLKKVPSVRLSATITSGPCRVGTEMRYVQ